MMGDRHAAQAALFYEFSLETHVPTGHLLRSIDRFVELDGLRRELAPFYSDIGRPSVDPELMIQMLIVGYCFGIRSERRLCEEATSASLTGGSVGSGSTARCPTIRPSRRTGMAAFARAIYCVGCSRACCSAVSTRAWSGVKALRSTPA
jgi:Transposase domain (DUF772)